MCFRWIWGGFFVLFLAMCLRFTSPVYHLLSPVGVVKLQGDPARVILREEDSNDKVMTRRMMTAR